MRHVPPSRAAAFAVVACVFTSLAIGACTPQGEPASADGGGQPPDAAVGRADGGPSPVDAAPPPDAFVPECIGDDDCGAGRGCRAGTCRDECQFGFLCYGAASGSVCHEGLCVECTADAHCGTGRMQCDQARAICEERPFDPSLARFGIFYSTWHCIAANNTPVHDISRVLAGEQSFGGYGVFHYWGRPAAGYYCPSNSDAVLRQHAEQLRDAGIDFAFIDATNHAYVDARSHDTPGMILSPLDRLLAVWSTVPGAPRLVPWVPVVEAGQSPTVYTVDAMLQRLAAYPGMHFEYLGKPLVLITANAQYPVDAAREAELAASYTVRRMWGMFASNGADWSFLQPCKASPTSSDPCDQRVASSGDGIEQISISVAYQQTFMNVATATPKHRGLTLRKQFQRAFDWPETPIITITGWNEWIAQRQPCGHEACPCSAYPDGCFIDQWDVEYNRDIEPGEDEMGDYYYRLMRSCIALFRAGEQCDGANAGDLCCREWGS
jgi:Cys-rich repeat protein